MRCLLVLALFVGCLSSAAVAEISIDVGDYDLLPNTPDQQILVFVTGGDLVQGLDLNVLIADGGPEIGGVIESPAITNTDILTGTIFQNNNTGVIDLGVSLQQFDARSTTTAAGTVAADGLLATLTIDTTGFFGGVFPLILSTTPNGPTAFAGVPARITDGSISIVPEPGSCSWGAVSLLAVSWRRRRSPAL